MKTIGFKYYHGEHKPNNVVTCNIDCPIGYVITELAQFITLCEKYNFTLIDCYIEDYAACKPLISK